MIEVVEICGENGAWYKVIGSKHLERKDNSITDNFRIK